MPVYVDDMEAEFGRMIMCHMIADTHLELVQMADTIGVARHWLQKPGSYGEHFDIAKSKRALAVAAGAIEISTRELADKCWQRRTTEGRAIYYAGTVAPDDMPRATSLRMPARKRR